MIDLKVFKTRIGDNAMNTLKVYTEFIIDGYRRKCIINLKDNEQFNIEWHKENGEILVFKILKWHQDDRGTHIDEYEDKFPDQDYQL